MTSQPIINEHFVTPEALVSHFHLRPGDEVADFGAGTGKISFIMARAVGATGKVYACEIQKKLVETVADNARRQNLDNVEALWCDIEAHQGTKLESDSIDVAVLINTLFQMEDKQEAINEIKRALRPGGKLFVVDWSDSFDGLGPQAENVISEVAARDLIEECGLAYERSYDSGSHHYGLAFRKP